jgi:hypothetical protein
MDIKTKKEKLKKFINVHPETPMPPAARGILFEKTTPLDPPQKLFIIPAKIFI